MIPIPVYNVKIPEYNVKSKPDWVLIGAKIDKIIKQYYMGEQVVIRCLSSKVHNGKTIGNLIKIIKKLGTDRYNPKRKGERYENIENKKIDFFALDFRIKKDSAIMENFIEPFYTWPIKFGGSPIRINIAIIYDLSKLKRVHHQYEGRNDIKKDGFVFKNPENKIESLKGIIKIL